MISQHGTEPTERHVYQLMQSPCRSSALNSVTFLLTHYTAAVLVTWQVYVQEHISLHIGVCAFDWTNSVYGFLVSCVWEGERLSFFFFLACHTL